MHFNCVASIGGGMIYNSLGRKALKISKISLGTWINFESHDSIKEMEKCFNLALDYGINSFDTADSYGHGYAEKTLGDFLSKTHYHRDDLIISTKCYFPRRKYESSKLLVNCGLNRKNIINSVNESCKNLKTDYIDILYCHRFDNEVPLYDILRTLNDLCFSGKIIYWGASKWSKKDLEMALKICIENNFQLPICIQELYNLFHTASYEDYLKSFPNYEVGFVGYSPLARGVLTGKYLENIAVDSRLAHPQHRNTIYNLDDKSIKQVSLLKKLSDDKRCFLSQLVLAYYLRKKACNSIIIGVSTEKQLIENVKSLDVSVNDELNCKINQIMGIL